MIKKKYCEKIFKYIIGCLFVLTPLLSAIMFCAMDGKAIWDIYIPLGGWSDEITYYKQIEGMVHFGIPKGFFGYNQSQALIGPFGVWGILPLIPYYLWGVVFGWSYISPIYANIFFCTVGLVVLLFVVKPNKKQMFSISLFWFLFAYLNRYVLSGVVESSVIMLLLGITACGIYLLSEAKNKKEEPNRERKEKFIYFIAIFLIFWLSLERPYYAVFYLIPFFWNLDKKRVKQIWILVLSAILGLVVFFVNQHYFCSTYFSNMLEVNGSFISQLVSGSIQIAKFMWYALRYHDDVGWYYLLLFAELIMMIVNSTIRLLKRKRLNRLFISAIVGEILILLSLIYIYDLTVGARHILALIVMNAVLIICELDYKWVLFLCAICIASKLLCKTPMDLPYSTKEYVERMDELEEEFSQKVILSNDISYSNVVAMPTADIDENDSNTGVSTYYGLLYAMPAGVGISLDFPEFYEETDNIKAKYILVHPSGEIKRILENAGMKCVIADEEFLLYMNESQ